MYQLTTIKEPDGLPFVSESESLDELLQSVVDNVASGYDILVEKLGDDGDPIDTIAVLQKNEE